VRVAHRPQEGGLYREHLPGNSYFDRVLDTFYLRSSGKTLKLTSKLFKVDSPLKVVVSPSGAATAEN
ncbi:MAG: hypothetical protein WBG42_12755, partial [Cryomorphaceae bacterium]